MKKLISILLPMFIILTSVPFSVQAKTDDLEIIINPDMLSEKSYTPIYSKVGDITVMSERDSLPSSFDARDYGWVTPLKRQTWGTCWSHAKLSVFETYNISQGLGDIHADYSEAHLAWFANTKSTDVNNPTYGDGVTLNYNPDDYFVEYYPNADKMGPYLVGASHTTAIGALARWSGIADESDFSSEKDGLAIDEEHRYNTGSDSVIKSAEWLTNITEVKNWVKSYGSATISFSYGNITDGPNNTNISWSYKDVSENTAFHEVAIIGWDDQFPTREKYSIYQSSPELMPPADGAWLCKDSNGYYLWLSYYDASIIDIVGFTAQPANTYRENYTYNGTCAVMHGLLQGSASVANVFKTDEYEILSAISTYTVNENQNMNIKVYTNLNSNYTNPTQGTLVLNFPVNIARKGYHTIKLPQDIKLIPDTYFSVVVEYEATNGTTQIPVEYDYNYGNVNFTYSSNKGESFVCENNTWSYSEDRGVKNIYVQAFTNCDHRPEITTVPASCKEYGYTQTKCTQCSEVFELTVFPKLEHNYNCVIEALPTATADGSKKQVCTSCGDETDLQTLPATGFEITNGMIIDYTNNTIYGLTAGTDSLDEYTNFVVDGYEWVYGPGRNGFGTGSKAILKKNSKAICEYTVIIFGDVNGDSWYDGEDAFLVNLIVKGMLNSDDVDEAMWTAADCNHDGVIDEADVELLSGAGLKLNNVDQSATSTELMLNADYIEYIMLIDQSTDMIPTVNPDADNAQQDATYTNTNPEQPADEINIGAILITIFDFIKMIFTFVFSFINK